MLSDDQAPPGADELLTHCTKNHKAVHTYLNSYLLGDAKKLVNRDEMIGRSDTVWHTLQLKFDVRSEATHADLLLDLARFTMKPHEPIESIDYRLTTLINELRIQGYNVDDETKHALDALIDQEWDVDVLNE